MRGWVVVMCGVLGAIAAFGTSALSSSTVSANQAFSVSGSVAGGARTANVGDQVTFVFTEKNVGTRAAPESLILESHTLSRIERLSCVLPNGAVFNSDGSECEPGFMRPGQSSSAVVSVNITGAPNVALRVCLVSDNTGNVGPCQTTSVAST